jgi:hypothetical protein
MCYLWIKKGNSGTENLEVKARELIQLWDDFVAKELNGGKLGGAKRKPGNGIEAPEGMFVFSSQPVSESANYDANRLAKKNRTVGPLNGHDQGIHFDDHQLDSSFDNGPLYDDFNGISRALCQ